MKNNQSNGAHLFWSDRTLRCTRNSGLKECVSVLGKEVNESEKEQKQEQEQEEQEQEDEEEQEQEEQERRMKKTEERRKRMPTHKKLGNLYLLSATNCTTMKKAETLFMCSNQSEREKECVCVCVSACVYECERVGLGGWMGG